MTNWKFVGGLPCLDFVNTVGARVSGGRARVHDYSDQILREKFQTYEDLLSWSESADVLSAKQALQLRRIAVAAPRKAAATLGRARNLREALYRICKCVVEGWKPGAADMDVLRRELSVAQSHQTLTETPAGFGWEWDDAKGHLDRMLWPIVRCAADLMTSTDLANLRQCGGDECGWVFLDTSRNHGRQWCDMRDCGNRAKMKRFRQRQKRRRR